MHCTYCTRLTLDTVVALTWDLHPGCRLCGKPRLRHRFQHLDFWAEGLASKASKAQSTAPYQHVTSFCIAKQYHVDFARSPRRKDRDNNREPHNTQLQFVHLIFHIGSIHIAKMQPPRVGIFATSDMESHVVYKQPHSLPLCLTPSGDRHLGSFGRWGLSLAECILLGVDDMCSERPQRTELGDRCGT